LKEATDLGYSSPIEKKDNNSSDFPSGIISKNQLCVERKTK
jgi:hypothetical protein